MGWSVMVTKGGCGWQGTLENRGWTFEPMQLVLPIHKWGELPPN